MSTRVIGYQNNEWLREIVLEATLDGDPITISNIALSGFGATGAKKVTKGVIWPVEGQGTELSCTDCWGHETLILVIVNNVSVEDGTFDGTFIDLPGNAFDVI